MDESTGLAWYWILCIVLGVLLGFVALAYLYRILIGGRKYRKNNQIPGKVVLITGANTGIGKETAVELAKRGAKVYIACRSPERGSAALQEVIERSGNQNVFLRQLDLASLASVRKFAETFLKEEDRLDILINNAGVMACPKMLTEDGFEMQLGTNHLGHFLLTNLLLELVEKSAPARIINVSSSVHLWGKINKEDLMGEKEYTPFSAYCQSKLANVLFTKELARRLNDTSVSVNALHPGAINTDLQRHASDAYGAILGGMIKTITPYLFKTVVEGAQTTITCALDPELDKVTGEYFDNCRPSKVNKLANDEELAKWLWDESAKYTKLTEEV